MQDFKSFYSEASGGEGERCNYPTRLDTYGCGCSHMTVCEDVPEHCEHFKNHYNHNQDDCCNLRRT